MRLQSELTESVKGKFWAKCLAYGKHFRLAIIIIILYIVGLKVQFYRYTS